MKLDKSRCLSLLTQKKELTEDEKILMGSQLYGCDICQRVCPFNKAEPPTACFSPVEWLEKSDAELKEQYKDTAMWWRGLSIMRRNAELSIQNTQNQVS